MSYAPLPITYRELYLPEHIRGTQLPAFRGDAHALTLTGAQKRTTADGVHFTGTATSNMVIAANAGQDAKAAIHITIRFKLDKTFAAGAAGNFYFSNKVSAATYIRAYLKAADGKFYWEQDDGVGGAGFSLTSTTVSWAAGTWYTVTVSLTDTPTQRLLVNGTLEDSDTSAAVATPNGGDIVIGSSSAGGTDGVVGTISRVVIGVGATATVALTAAEEVLLNRGIPPPTAKVQHMYLFDEGMGVTCYDRGSIGVNGTLALACTWDWKQVRAPVLSSDGLNDSALTAAGVADLSGALTIEMVQKMKHTGTGLVTYNYLFHARIGAAEIELHFMGNNLNFTGRGVSVSYALAPAIDSYKIFHGVIAATGQLSLYANAVLLNTSAVPASGAATVGGAKIGIGCDYNGNYPDNSRTLRAAVIETALSQAQITAKCKWLRDRYNLPITI